MKVLKIEFEDYYHVDFINGLLQRGIFNDHLFECVWYTITVELDSCIQFLYRRMWESVYLRKGYSHFDIKSDKMRLTISLSEALQFIHTATPPRLKHLIPESTKSIKDITTLLKQFLMDDNSGQLITYISIFKKITHLEQFETVWDYDTKSIDVLREYGENPNGLVCSVVHCSGSIETIINDERSTPLIQVLFHCQNEGQLKMLIKLISFYTTSLNDPSTIMTSMYVLNIKPGNNGEFFIMCYSTAYHYPEEFRQLIKETYRKFIGRN